MNNKSSENHKRSFSFLSISWCEAYPHCTINWNVVSKAQRVSNGNDYSLKCSMLICHLPGTQRYSLSILSSSAKLTRNFQKTEIHLLAVPGPTANPSSPWWPGPLESASLHFAHWGSLLPSKRWGAADIRRVPATRPHVRDYCHFRREFCLGCRQRGVAVGTVRLDHLSQESEWDAVGVSLWTRNKSWVSRRSGGHPGDLRSPKFPTINANDFPLLFLLSYPLEPKSSRDLPSWETWRQGSVSELTEGPRWLSKQLQWHLW